ncbi:hypothetical protein AB0F03_37845 [Streptomyces sp. NPDC028722]|uniref:hypothetical protein n=1 Tax=Streptomyces sp. NPDC028722 TaxID=3155016 RepID=UPI0033CBB2BA
MPKETPQTKRARKAAAKAAARERAARIMASLVQPSRTQPRRSSAVKVVQAQPEKPARALIPPRDTPLSERVREQYADNAFAAWVKPGAVKPGA